MMLWTGNLGLSYRLHVGSSSFMLDVCFKLDVHISDLMLAFKVGARSCCLKFLMGWRPWVGGQFYLDPKYKF